MVGASRLCHLQLLLGRRRRNDGGAQQLADLDRGEADATAGAMHQQRLA